MSITWRQVAVLFPEFVQWVAQTHGHLPEECTEDDYTMYANEWRKRGV